MLRAVPKPTGRIKDKKAMERCRARGRCEIPGCAESFALHAHHIKTRGSGGDDTDDNLICLCAQHHAEAHGGTIQKGELQAIVANRPENRLRIV